MGVVDKATFAEIKRSGGNIGPFIRMIEGAKAVASMEVILVFFAMFAILSSLLSASLGLCDYFRDLLKNRMAKKNEMLPVLLTYLPPALFCIIKPDGFLLCHFLCWHSTCYMGSVATAGFTSCRPKKRPGCDLSFSFER
ncbi:aromatic amino acid transport family protein [Erwinia sp. E_sp_B01_9]